LPSQREAELSGKKEIAMAGVATAHRSKAQPDSARWQTPRRLAPKVRRNVYDHAFLIGAVLCFTFFSWYPIVREVIMSFQKPVYGGYAWAGWSDYIRIFRDPTFWQAWRNTFEFTLLALAFGYAVPFVVAIILNELRHARGYLRVLVYLPVMLPPASALLLFAYFYNPQYGLFDEILRFLHLPTSQWVFTPGTGFVSIAMISVVIASTWMNMGAATLIYLAALQNIPGELYEAAELDGAGLLKRIRHITIPQTKLILLMLLVLQIVATMQMFVESFVLTNQGGGVGDNTLSVVMLIYQYAFALSGASNYNSASALGVVLMLVLAAFSGAFLWLTRERG
jgi:multiple sugar transport system permease protein